MWELTILEAGLPALRLDSLACADLDGDGRVELVTGGDGLFWYRPATREWGRISDRYAHVGVVLQDIDGDGRLEVVIGESQEVVSTSPVTKAAGRGPISFSQDFTIAWYKPGRSLGEPWMKGFVDRHFEGHAHDLVFADIDADGEPELVAISCYSARPGIFIYERGSDLSAPWRKHAVQEGIFSEGLCCADLDGDGRLEIVCGPDWYEPPAAGAWSGSWTRRTWAPNFREMCRTAAVPVAGSPRPDLVIVESEYLEGQLSWFENPGDPRQPWREHRILNDVCYGHSLDARSAGGGVSLMVAEMEQGGWEAPFNHDARVLLLESVDRGRSWRHETAGTGDGTHQAIRFDLDGDGEEEIVGKEYGFYHANPRLQVWKRLAAPPAIAGIRHRFVDRDKPYTGLEIVACDIDGDGRNDLACGAWWYRNPDWRRYPIPGITQVVNAYDVDGDGRTELVCLRAPARCGSDFYGNLRPDLVWLKPVDPEKGDWLMHDIGRGRGDWPHGTLLGPFGPAGKLALAAAWHSAHVNPRHHPQIFVAPVDPGSGSWSRGTLAPIPHPEQMLACDIAGNGRQDIVAGGWWLENRGDGTFEPHRFAPPEVMGSRIALMDIRGTGKPDIVVGQEKADWARKKIPMSPLAWFERPDDPRQVPWTMHLIDSVFCAHSLGVGDVDGDGEPEIVVGEHDPFWPYRSRCRLIAYKKADPRGGAWRKHTLDGRFEHHDGAKVFEIAPGRWAIASHGWKDSIYVHVWERTGE